MQIDQPKMTMKMHQINLSQDTRGNEPNQEKIGPGEHGDLMEYTGGHSTMKHSSFHQQEIPGASAAQTGRSPHQV